MLVLTRRIGERLRIGPDIELVVLEVRGREVKLGVAAPVTIPVHREEIYRRIQEANRAAALGQPDLTDVLARAARALRARHAHTPESCAPSSAR